MFVQYSILYIYILLYIYVEVQICHVVFTTQHAVFTKVISVDLELIRQYLKDSDWIVHGVWNSQEDNTCVYD